MKKFMQIQSLLKVFILFMLLPLELSAANIDSNFKFNGKEYSITNKELQEFKNLDKAQEAIEKKKYSNRNNEKRAMKKAMEEEKVKEEELQEDEEYIYLNENCIKKDKGFWNNEPGRGWFWGQEECVPVKRKKKVEVDLPKEEEEEEYMISEETGEKYKILPKKAKVPFDLLDQLDPDEISQRIEPETRKIVVMYPTDENILEYRKLKNWIMAKAMVLAKHDVQVRTEHPHETMPGFMTSRTDEVRGKAVRKIKSMGKTEIINKYVNENKIMLVVYKQEGCKFCYQYNGSLSQLLEFYPKLKIELRDIYREGAREAVQLNVQTTPDTFLIFRNDQGQIRYQRILTGHAAFDKIEDAIIRGLSYLGEDIDDLYFSY